MTSKFYNEINGSLVEREVENIYNKGISLYFPNVDIVHPFACDGLIDTKTDNGKLLKLIIEYKFDEDMQSRMARAKIIIQVLYYMKRFEDNGLILPNVCLIADKNECFVFHTNDIIDFLDEETDWTIAPSSAHILNPDFVLKIAQSEKLNPYIFNVDDNFSFKAVADKIKDLAANVQRYVHITEHNIANIYETFLGRVIKNSKKYSSKELVSIFMGIITNGDEYYKHPSKKNCLVTPKGNVEIDNSKFDSFFSYFQKNYTPQEIVKFTEIADRLIEDTERRNSGDFFTPTLFVDKAHRMIEQQFGEDWKENYVVWDCAAGTLNLTRDYYFKELYCSTLFDSELEIGKNYNKEATKFQFDFLNDYLPMPNDLISEGNKVPDGLVQALKENKPFIFFINPPYGKSTGQKNMQAGQTTETAVCKQMKADKLDSSEFIKQFLYRITKIKEAYNLTNVNVCCFTNPSWMLKPQSENFRKLWFKNFKFENGIMFCASEFADCSSQWGITFNIWTSGEQEEKNNFVHTLVEKNEDNEIVTIGEKTLYNFDGQDIITTNQYIQAPNKNSTKTEKEIVYCKDNKNIVFEKANIKATDDYICTIDCPGNDIQQNQFCQISNRKLGIVGGNLALTKSNLLESCVVLTIKQLITTNWAIDKDQYNMNVTIPDTFKYDCLAKALFANYCMSYRLENDRLKNEFFWMSKDEMLNLANENNNNELFTDARTDTDRFVYKFIEEHKSEFSAEALEVLQAAKDLVHKSFKYRQMFNDEEPKYQINNWDCGWYQIKALCKMFCPDDLKAFMGIYKKFADKLRPQVYELGFLRQ